MRSNEDQGWSPRTPEHQGQEEDKPAKVTVKAGEKKQKTVKSWK